jgi:hypothetical protein
MNILNTRKDEKSVSKDWRSGHKIPNSKKAKRTNMSHVFFVNIIILCVLCGYLLIGVSHAT